MNARQWTAAGLAAAAALAFCKWQNDGLTVSHLEYRSKKIPKDLDGLRILHVSDFHNKKFGKDQRRIINKIEAERPGLIFITGDLVDSRRTDLESAMKFIEGIMPLAPVYYVAGNHEFRLKQRRYIFRTLEASGVHVLENQGVTLDLSALEKGAVRLIGLPDPSSVSGTQGKFRPWVLQKLERNICSCMEEGMLNILLIHRPELFQLYARCGVDLAFCGHAHGGQIRLPFIGGLNAPNQGFFPRYSEGVHKSGGTTMIVSRGIGNSLAPQRLGNRPELISVTLKAADGFAGRRGSRNEL